MKSPSPKDNNTLQNRVDGKTTMRIKTGTQDEGDTTRNGQPPKSQLTKKSTCPKKSTR